MNRPPATSETKDDVVEREFSPKVMSPLDIPIPHLWEVLADPSVEEATCTIVSATVIGSMTAEGDKGTSNSQEGSLLGLGMGTTP